MNRTGIIALCLAVLLAGAGASTARQTAPLVPCAEMRGKLVEAGRIGLPTRGAQVTSATLVAAVRADPEYCRIEGSILPNDRGSPPINFALAVPSNWNGGSWHVGGAGTNGSIPSLTSTGAGSTPPGAQSLLAQGFAVFGSDSGHQGPGTAWVREREAWLNFSYEQLKKTSDTAARLLEIHRGATPARRYFSGSSQGGREALEVVARYPADYDGVYAHVPLAYFQGLLIDPTIKMQIQARPGAWIPPSKHGLITQEILRACDNLDGATDGVISNYVGCARALDPTVANRPLRNLNCPSGADEGDPCLSDAQLATLNSLHGPVTYSYVLPNGQRDWPGWGPGADVTLLSRTAPNPATGEGNFGIGAGVQRQLFGGTTDFNLYQLSLETHRPTLERISRELDVPADWSAFFARGGKLIMVTAAADTISNPRAQMRLYDEVVRTNGQAAVDGAVRYYVVPHANHGGQARSASGEAQPSRWDPVRALRGWVEGGLVPPDAPVMAAYEGQAVTMERPLCRYPRYPHFIGIDRKAAADYACRAP